MTGPRGYLRSQGVEAERLQTVKPGEEEVSTELVRAQQGLSFHRLGHSCGT